MAMEDLAEHEADWCGTISQSFDDVELHEIPPNGQGIAALMALGILENTSIRDHGPDDLAAVHLQLEAIKLAYSDLHRFVADRRFMTEVPETALLDPDYLKARAALISMDQAQNLGHGAPKRGGTVLLNTADASGMMVSFIQSNYAGFGSGVVVPETGIALQNRGFGFVTEEGTSQLCGAEKAPVPYDHPRLCHERWGTDNGLWHDGRTNSGTGPYAALAQNPALGSGCANRRRCSALAHDRESRCGVRADHA